MAAVLVLVRSDLDLPDKEVAERGLLELYRQYQCPIQSNLTRTSIDLLEKTYAQDSFPVYISGLWDPPRFPGAIQDNYILAPDEIQSTANQTNAHYESPDWDTYEGETTEEYKARVKQAWQGNSSLIVITGEKQIKTWVEAKGGNLEDPVPAVVVWREGRVIDVWRNWEEVKGSRRPEEAKEHPKPAEIIDGRSLSIPELLQDSLLTLTSDFSSQLASALEVSLHSFHPSSDSVSSTLQTAIAAVTRLETQTSHTLEELETRILEVDVVKGEQEKELREITEEVEDIKGKQMEVERLLKELSETWTPAVVSLHSQLSTLKTSQDSFAQELLSAQAQLLPAYPISFLSISLHAPLLQIVLHSRKYYQLYGYLQLYRNEELIWGKGECDTFNPGKTVVEIPMEWEDCSGIEVRIYHFAGQERELAARGKVRLDGDYEQSFLYQCVQSEAGLEEQIVNKRGNEGLEVFKWLAVNWKNPTQAQVDSFLQGMLDETQDLPQVKVGLESQGLVFN